MQGLSTSINVLQLLLPFISLGDLATDIWYILTLFSMNQQQPQKYNTPIQIAIISLAFGVIVGFSRICCEKQRMYLKANIFVHLFYYICHPLNIEGMFLFLYQRYKCFGPRYYQFQDLFEKKKGKIWLCLINVFVYGLMFGSQVISLYIFQINAFTYINIALTGIMMFYNFFLIPYFYGQYRSSIKNMSQENRTICCLLCLKTQMLGNYIQDNCFRCCPKRPIQPLDPALQWVHNLIKSQQNLQNQQYQSNQPKNFDLQRIPKNKTNKKLSELQKLTKRKSRNEIMKQNIYKMQQKTNQILQNSTSQVV